MEEELEEDILSSCLNPLQVQTKPWFYNDSRDGSFSLNPLQVQTKPIAGIGGYMLFGKSQSPIGTNKTEKLCVIRSLLGGRLNPLQVQTKRTTIHAKSKKMGVSQSPIGTNKTLPIPHFWGEQCTSQSPIGTNKTHENEWDIKGNEESLNPLQVQTKPSLPTLLQRLSTLSQSPIGTNKTISPPFASKQCRIVSIPYRYKQNEDDLDEMDISDVGLNPLQVQTKLIFRFLIPALNMRLNPLQVQTKRDSCI